MRTRLSLVMVATLATGCGGGDTPSTGSTSIGGTAVSSPGTTSPGDAPAPGAGSPATPAAPQQSPPAPAPGTTPATPPDDPTGVGPARPGQPGAEPAPAPANAESDSATFLDRPWRESATLAARVLTGSSLEAVGERVRAAVNAVEPDATGNASCPDRGSLFAEDVPVLDGTGGNDGSTSTVRFDGCIVGNDVFDGSYVDSSFRTSRRIGDGDGRRQEYALSIFADIGPGVDARGSLETTTGNATDKVCDAGRRTAEQARFDSVDVRDDELGVVLRALSTSMIESTDVLGTSPCLVARKIEFDGGARYASIASGTQIEVSRTGTARFADGEAATMLAPSDAVLDIRAAGDAGTRLRLESTSSGDVALVTIDENGSTVSFEAPWRFGREVGTN